MSKDNTNNVIPFRPKAKEAPKRKLVPANEEPLTNADIPGIRRRALYALISQSGKMLGISHADIERMLLLQFGVKNIDALLGKDFDGAIAIIADLHDPDLAVMH